ncbi:MAG: UDP-glucose/GDP-mannose dehydrogenase family protein [Candidatus Omnitrophica bacterium]|nr:UDP-glucose/GDP-mannose dehydrogenase family protein [Candidatus Omnitrophota bacterium]
MNISIIGSGYVGLVSGTCFADLGNNVICADNNKEKISSLKDGIVTMYEPGLEELIKKNTKRGTLKFTTSTKEAVEKSEIIFICVNTPPKNNGQADLIYVEKVCEDIAKYMNGYKLIVEKSTVPVNTAQRVNDVINSFRKKGAEFDIASNPEFLREGSAINDLMHPDRVVVGVNSKKAEKLLKDLYEPLKTKILVTNISGAELIKHASNSFLAMKISFINAVANICERVGADIEEVAAGIGSDKRIGPAFLSAGIGYGGSCFPKDVQAFTYIAEELGYDFGLLKEVEKINEQQKEIVVKKCEELLWNLLDKKIGILGLAFKPDTDDIRCAPALHIIKRLQEAGCKIKAYDPKAMDNVSKTTKGITFCKDAYAVAKDVDCLLVLTEWNDFKELDLTKIKNIMRQPILIDGRNMYDPKKMKKLGFKYACIGRKI